MVVPIVNSDKEKTKTPTKLFKRSIRQAKKTENNDSKIDVLNGSDLRSV